MCDAVVSIRALTRIRKTKLMIYPDLTVRLNVYVCVSLCALVVRG